MSQIISKEQRDAGIILNGMVALEDYGMSGPIVALAYRHTSDFHITFNKFMES